MANTVEAPISPWTRRGQSYLWPTPETEKSEVYQAMSYQMPHQTAGRNPLSWKAHLAMWRKKHPEQFSGFKEAGKAYRSLQTNPSVFMNPHKMDMMGWMIAGGLLIGLKMLSNRQ